MIACTSPAFTASESPLRIGVPPTVAWRLVISSMLLGTLVTIGIEHGLFAGDLPRPTLGIGGPLGAAVEGLLQLGEDRRDHRLGVAEHLLLGEPQHADAD